MNKLELYTKNMWQMIKFSSTLLLLIIIVSLVILFIIHLYKEIIKEEDD